VSAFVVWVTSLLVAAAPPSQSRGETEHEATARYTAIAEDIVYAVESSPPMFGGPFGKERTAALMGSVAFLESGLRMDVDMGLVRGKAGECGLWQVMPARRGSCAQWTTDRRAGAVEALGRMRKSQGACLRPGVPIEHMLAAYTSGRCSAGLVQSRARVELAQRWYARRPPPTHGSKRDGVSK
jgi:hypothetical protein